jgi:DNA-binding IclR family transcriptional regulator
MRQLSQETNETICLNTIIEDKRVCISKIEGNETLRQFIEVGRSTPMHRGGSGKLLLAFTEEDKRERIISNIEDEEKDFIIKLKKELEEVRKEGVASSRGERILGAASISAPIFDKNGNLLGGIAISSASIRINDETENKYKQLIIEKAKEISRLMGYKS